MEFINYLWAWLAVWLSWIWVAIWQWILAKRSVEVMWQKPDMATFFLTITILWMALVESVVIYWLVIAFQIMWDSNLWLYTSLWAWLSIWLTWFWAWWWIWQLIAWAMWAMVRNPDIKWKIMTFMVLFVALVEVTAIYWLIIAFKILWAEWQDNMLFLWAWLAIWLAWLWVAIWRWFLSEKSLEIIGQNPSSISFILTVSILWIALVESRAIYWLVVAFKILWDVTIAWARAIWAWLAIWLTWLWAWLWEGLLIKWALQAMNQSPENRWKIMAFMVLFVALVEVIAIYWLIIAFKAFA